MHAADSQTFPGSSDVGIRNRRSWGWLLLALLGVGLGLGGFLTWERFSVGPGDLQPGWIAPATALSEAPPESSASPRVASAGPAAGISPPVLKARLAAYYGEEDAAELPPVSGQSPAAPGTMSDNAKRADSDLAESDRQALARAGTPWDEKGSEAAGFKLGLLSKMAKPLLDHPAALRLLFNNKSIVKGYMSRDLVRRGCSSPAVLKSYLMDTRNPEGVRAKISLVQTFLQNGRAASAFAGTEFARELASCPSVKALSNDPGSLSQVMSANPGVLNVVMHPNLIPALSASPQMLGMYQSAIHP